MNGHLFEVPQLTVPIPARGRDPLDRFYTPAHPIRAFLAYLGRRIKGCAAWEPCSGGGAIARELERWCSSVYRSDIDPDAVGLDELRDFLSYTPTDAPNVDWIVTNTPYKNGARFIEQALTLAPRCAFLCRITMLEGAADRLHILTGARLTDVVMAGRVSFEGPAIEAAKLHKPDSNQHSDSVPHAWLVFDQHAPHPNTIHHYLEAA